MDTQRKNASELLAQTANSIANYISTRMEVEIRALSRMSARWNMQGGTPYNYWLDDAQAYIVGQEFTSTVEWVDSNYTIQWIAPVKGNEHIVGININYDDQRRQMLQDAAVYGKITLSPPLLLKQGYTAFLSYSPVFKNTIFDGFIVGVHPVEKMVSAAIGDHIFSKYRFSLSHLNEVFYTSNSALRLNNDQIGETEKKSFDIFNKTIDLEIVSIPSNKNFIHEFLPYIVLVFGSTTAILVQFLIRESYRTRFEKNRLKHKEYILHTFVKHTPAAVAMFDEDTDFVIASDRWLKEIYAPDAVTVEISGKISVKAGHNTEFWCDLLAKSSEGEYVHLEELELNYTGCESKWFKYESLPVNEVRYKKSSFILFMEDITERKKIDSVKDEFVSTVSHELRTPLTSIQGALGILTVSKSAMLDQKGQRLLAISLDNCKRLTGLVNDILDMNKIIEGKMEFNIEDVELISLTRVILEQNKPYASVYDVVFEFEYSVDSILVKIDSNRFNQALTNIISNAVKFTPKGGCVKVCISVEKEQQVKMSVIDQGPGIPLSFQKKFLSVFVKLMARPPENKEVLAWV